MPPEKQEETGALEKMREKLYSADAPQTTLGTGAVSPAPAPVPRGWEAAPRAAPVTPPHERMPIAVKFFIGALIFFGITGLVTGAYLIFGGRSISTQHVDILVVGPTTAASGETVSLMVTVQNRNPVDIDVKGFGVDFPAGTRNPDNVDEELSHVDDELGAIESGSGVTRTIRATVFGSENQTISIPIRVEYATEGSNAIFVTDKTYSITITTSPLSVNATSVTQTSSGQSITFSLAVRANATEPLPNVGLKAEYPFGFTVSNASIESRNNGSFFALGTLRPGEEKRFTVTGVIAGANEDTRVFRFTTGTTKSDESSSLEVEYATAVSEIAITRPFLDASLTIGGDASAKPVIAAGKTAQGVVNWKNTLSSPILDGKVTVRLSGSALDPSAIGSHNGFYQSSDLSILFDRDTNGDLAELEPGDTGSGSFSFASKSGDALRSVTRPVITATVSVAGRRVAETGVPETLTSTLTREIKIATDLTLASDVVYSVGPFNNAGPFPPVHDQKTTYTVRLVAENTVNEVGGAAASMTLPSYVRFTGKTNPSDGSISYSEATRTVTWNIGDIPAHGKEEAAFQIEFLPSLSQQNSAPMLVSAQKLSGTDRFTQTSVGMTGAQLNTQLRSDPAYEPIDGQVQ